MRNIFLGSLVMSSLLFANSEFFPDVLSSEESINFYSSVEISGSGEELVTPKMDNKNKAKCDSSLFKDKFCFATGEKPKALKEFKFLASSVSETLEVNSDMTISDENVANLVITKDNLTITFDAPSVTGLFNRTQKIASIKDSAKNTTLIFRAGDYYIGNLEVNSNSKKVHDRVEIKTEGNSRLFIKDKFEISKTTNANPKDDVIVINKDKSAKELMIYSLGSINIDTTASFSINALIYGFSDFNIVGNPQSSFKGAIHSKGSLNVGDKKTIGEFVYDEEAIEGLSSDGFKLYSLPDIPSILENQSTLAGVDSNRNGVRDDMEIFIIKKFPDSPALQVAYLEDFKLFQEELTTEFNEPTKKENQLKAREITNRHEITTECQMEVFFRKFGNTYEVRLKEYHLLEDIEDKMVNSLQRISKYIEYNGLLSGGNYGGIDGSIEELCPPYIIEALKEEEKNEK